MGNTTQRKTTTAWSLIVVLAGLPCVAACGGTGSLQGGRDVDGPGSDDGSDAIGGTGGAEPDGGVLGMPQDGGVGFDAGPPPDPGPQSGTVVAAVSASRTSCVAPCTIFFDARATTRGGANEAERLLALDYVWDFGDPDSGAWQHGARATSERLHSRNVDTGFVGAHTYEEGGAYEVTLDVCAPDGCDRATIALSVVDADAHWSGRDTICFSNGSDHQGCPAGAEEVDNATDFDAAVADNGCDTTTKRCLFRAGDVFQASTSARFEGDSERYVGTYGPNCPGASCNRARVELAQPTTVLSVLPGSENVRIVDLQLVGDGQADTAINASVAPVYRLLMLRTHIEDFDQGFTSRCSLNASSGQCVPGTPNFPREIAFIDSSVTHGTSAGGNDMFIAGEPYAVMGSKLADKRDPNTTGGGVGEHVLRSKFAGPGTVISHNDFGLFDNAVDPSKRSGHAYVGCFPEDISDNDVYPHEPGWQRFGGNRGNTIIKIVSGYAVNLAIAGRPPEPGRSRYYVFADNWISACRYGTWSMTIAATDRSEQKAPEHHRFFIVERNLFSAQYNDHPRPSYQAARIASASDYVLRNNVFDMRGGNGSHDGVHIAASGPHPSQPDYIVPRDGHVYHNSGVNGAGRTGRELIRINSAAVSNVSVANNLLYDPDGTNAIVSDSGAGTSCCGGACPGSCNLATDSNPFATMPATPLVDAFQLSTSLGQDSAMSLPDWSLRDVGLCERSSDTGTDLGAWEIPAQDCR